MRNIDRSKCKSEQVIFDGKRYNRYPESNKKELQNYFSTGGGGKRLHVAVWEFYNGKVPIGYHIHHKDSNSLNNSISNLECITVSEHISTHSKYNFHNNKEYRNKQERHLKKIRPLTIKGHRSNEGREGQRDHERMVFGNRPFIQKTCLQCGKLYQTKNKVRTKFCSNNCKSKYRRSIKKDMERRKCVICQTEFIINRYSKTKTCGKISCIRTLRRKTLKS